MIRCLLLSAAVLIGLAAPRAAEAQTVPLIDDWVLPLPTVGADAERSVRTGHLLGEISPDGFLLRSPSSRTAFTAPDSAAGELQAAVLVPELLFQWNGAIPFSQNDAGLWAAKGTSVRAQFGSAFRFRNVAVIVAPEVTYSANADYTLLPDSLTRPSVERSPYVAPWYTVDYEPEWYALPTSIDMPLRFGDEPYGIVGLGQSSVTVAAGSVAYGLASENHWWGPGVRNALVLSNNAEGFPHAFLRTAEPLATPLGDIEARWLVGGLTESLFFDDSTDNDLRSISALGVTLRPPFAPGLTLGAARSVIASIESPSDVLTHAGDVALSWERRDSVGDNAWQAERPQLLSLFGRWVLPENGLEAYVEWVRSELPVSFRDFMVAPQHTQGYTLGLGWAARHRYGTTHLQAESTFLEFSPTFRNRPWTAHYTSPDVPQGFTHRGQTLGAAIGPGSSSLWFAADHSGSGYTVGVFANRIRWQVEALQRSISPNRFRTFRSFHAFDVSLIGGVHAGMTLGRLRVDAEYALERRLNFLFQNPDSGYGSGGAVDVTNPQFRIRIEPVWGTRD